MKIWKIVFGTVLLSVMVIGGCAVRAWQRDQTAKRFCESLIPRIEQTRAENGMYPSEADPVWWGGEDVPSLIRTQHFYFVRDNSFGFCFQNDSWVFNNVWEFESTSRRWGSFDANYEKK